MPISTRELTYLCTCDAEPRGPHTHETGGIRLLRHDWYDGIEPLPELPPPDFCRKQHGELRCVLYADHPGACLIDEPPDAETLELLGKWLQKVKEKP